MTSAMQMARDERDELAALLEGVNGCCRVYSTSAYNNRTFGEDD